jgi:hypothetical protein
MVYMNVFVTSRSSRGGLMGRRVPYFPPEEERASAQIAAESLREMVSQARVRELLVRDLMSSAQVGEL